MNTYEFTLVLKLPNVLDDDLTDRFSPSGAMMKPQVQVAEYVDRFLTKRHRSGIAIRSAIANATGAGCVVDRSKLPRMPLL